MEQTLGGRYAVALMQGTYADGVTTGATATANGNVMYPTQRSDGAYTHHRVQIEGISGDTITFEGTIDGSTWYGMLYTNMATGTAAATATADGIYYASAPVLGLMQVRARLTRSAGTVIITGVLTA